METKKAGRLKIQKPVAPLLKPVKLDYAKFFKAVMSGVKNIVVQDWSKVVMDVMDGAAALNLATTPEELAHVLLERSITKSLFEVIGETNFRNLLDSAGNSSSVAEFITEELDAADLYIDRHFFDRPTSLSVLPKLQGG